MEPVYRKYSNNHRFFKVIDSQTFHEFQVIGSRYQQYLIKADTYPERLFIQDLIACSFDGVEELSEAEFRQQLDELKARLQEIKPHQN
ncbi:MAG: hypothetical protein ACPF8V_07510 [Luteibaculum sp.]